jgi:hypothetical protein
MPTPLELRLHRLSLDFARRVAGIISELTIEDLAALSGEGASVAKTRRKKTRPVPRPRPAPKPKPRAAASTGSTRSTASTPSTEPPPAPPVFRVVQPPEDRAAAFRRAEQERLESAVLKFVEQNPGTDAEIVAVRVGLPKGQAQGLLDDLVLRGKLRMKSGQHGRCYRVVEQEA